MRQNMTPNSAAPRLLVVDDIEDNRTILRRRFTRLGYEVLEADDGATALAMARTYPFDLVLLDVMMPGIDGLEVLRTLRETHSETELPVIMVTAKAASEDVVEALRMGANDYITKPVDMEVAAARVEMQLRRKLSEDRSRAARQELEETLSGLAEAVEQAQNRAALLGDMGAETRGPLVGVLAAAGVLTRVCDSPELTRIVEAIDTARALLDQVVLEAVSPDGVDRRRVRLAHPIRVLLAGGDKAQREAARAVLAEAGVSVEVKEVASGKALYAAAGKTSFDLLMINADDADVLKAIPEIRRDEAEAGQRRRPILALASEARGALKALDAGCDLHAALPLTAAGLLAALARALRRESEDLTAAA